MATREWNQEDIEAASEAAAIHSLRSMRPNGIKPKKPRGISNRNIIAAARIPKRIFA